MKSKTCLFLIALVLSTSVSLRSFYSHNSLWSTSAYPDNQPWRLVGGNGLQHGWDQKKDRYNQIRKLLVHKNELYAALVNIEKQRGEIWKYNGRRWRKVAGEGINGSWQDGSFSSVASLASDGMNLYAGTGNRPGKALVWKMNPDGKWTLIGGNGYKGSWDQSYDMVRNLNIYKKKLIAGLAADHCGQNKAPFYQYDGKKWEVLTGINGERNGWDLLSTYFIGYVSVSWGDHLYLGTAGRGDATADIWMYDGNAFSQIGGDGIRGSWNNVNLKFIEDAIVFKDKLYVSTQGAFDGFGQFTHPIWMYDGVRWTSVGHMPAEWITNTIFNKLLEYHGELYAAAGGLPGSMSLWKLRKDNVWEKVGGQGLDGSRWDINFGHFSGYYEWVYTMAEFQNKIFLGFASSLKPYAAEVWSYPNPVSVISARNHLGNEQYHLRRNNFQSGLQQIQRATANGL